MLGLTRSQVIIQGKLASTSQSSNFTGKIGFYFPEINFTKEFPGSNFLQPTFSIGSKPDFMVENLPLATVNFEP